MGKNSGKSVCSRHVLGLPFVLVDGKWKFDWYGDIKFGYIFKRLFLAFILYWIAWFLLMGNLWWYSVYYAKNMPHKEDTDPVLALLVENLEWINLDPPEGFEYDFDGYNVIKTDGPGDDIYLSCATECRYRDSNNLSYIFDDSFKLLYVIDGEKWKEGNFYKIPNDEVNIDEVKKEIYEFVDPLVKLYDVEPWINLQWVFNWYYHDRFN